MTEEEKRIRRRIADKKFRDSHKEKRNAHNKKYRESNSEYFKLYGNKYRKENPDYFKEWLASLTKEEKENVKYQIRNAYHKHRAKENNSDITTEYLKELYSNSITCPICGTSMEKGNYINSKNLDHIIPIVAGGTHTQDNIRIICKSCNLKRPKDGRDEILKAIFLITKLKNIHL